MHLANVAVNTLMRVNTVSFQHPHQKGPGNFKWTLIFYSRFVLRYHVITISPTVNVM